MNELVLYASPLSSAIPVALALLELDVPHERIDLDLAAGDQRKPAFLALNPNGKVPTLVIDGEPMFEALAILQWLGERFGVERGLWPAADTAARFEALSWSTWTYVTFGGTQQRLIHATSPRFPAKCHNAAQAKLASEQLQSHLALLEARLEGRAHLLGDAFSLLDVIVGSAVSYAAFTGVPLAAHPRVEAWVNRFTARDAYAAAWGESPAQ
ncbi:glutathione S-transferase [Plesiocystis pacifica SIR-1]|uniref:Glutathione S-transferase n=1 Tax=Plesiocystis pacifica SIR-1 TaxID=391625 RepID=A6GAF3_9BACT|nr:glutathione S-transferase family protein [Plesiocystis pacifica]EDM77141.1 glutathione S-transferase [Plesiocystis pacifica SIR-1]